MESSDNHSKEPNISVVTARLFEIILDMPFKSRRILLKDLEAKHSQGRRRFARKPYFMPVDFATPDRAFSGFIQNISHSSNQSFGFGKNGLSGHQFSVPRTSFSFGFRFRLSIKSLKTAWFTGSQRPKIGDHPEFRVTLTLIPFRSPNLIVAGFPKGYMIFSIAFFMII